MKSGTHLTGRLLTLFSLVLGLFFASTTYVCAEDGNKTKYLAGELLIQTKIGVSRDTISQAFKAHGATALGELERIRVRRIKVPIQALEKVKAALSKNPHFSFVENNYLATGAAEPNDSYYPSQWHLKKISAPAGWDLCVGSSGETIAVIDSGVDPTHPDLAAKLVGGYNFLDGNTDTHDVLGHGTAVAGSAAAITDNATGVAGVAWQNPIMPLVVLSSDNWATYYDIARAITYAVDQGVRVLNISIGGSSSSITLQNAINYAWERGALVFVAAANYNTSTPYYPAACTHAVAVAATTSSDTKASFSNYGDWIDIAAPGTSILTTNRGGGYGSWNGTSFSSPIAAGLAALIWSIDPSLTNTEVLDIMTRNADDLGDAGFDVYYGFGRINVAASLSAAAHSLPIPDTIQPEVSITSPLDGEFLTGPTTITVSAVDDIGVERVDLHINGTLLSSKTAPPYAFYWDTGTSPEGPYDLCATAVDGAGNTGVTSVTVYLTSPPDLEPPTVSILSPEDGSNVTGLVTVSVSAVDDRAVERVELYIDGQLLETKELPPFDFIWDTEGLPEGEYEISAIGVDASGNAGQSPAILVYVQIPPQEDTIPPEVIITSPSDGSILEGPTMVRVSASDDIAVQDLELYINGTLTASSSSETLDYTWDTTTFPVGTYLLSALARDGAGNIGTSSAVTVEVSRPEVTTIPVVVIQSPEDGSSLSTKEVVKAVASDPDGISRMELYIDGVLKAARASDVVILNWNTRRVSRGTHVIEAKAYDLKGDVGSSSVTVYK